MPPKTRESTSIGLRVVAALWALIAISCAIQIGELWPTVTGEEPIPSRSFDAFVGERLEEADRSRLLAEVRHGDVVWSIAGGFLLLATVFAVWGAVLLWRHDRRARWRVLVAVLAAGAAIYTSWLGSQFVMVRSVFATFEEAPAEAHGAWMATALINATVQWIPIVVLWRVPRMRRFDRFWR